MFCKRIVEVVVVWVGSCAGSCMLNLELYVIEVVKNSPLLQFRCRGFLFKLQSLLTAMKLDSI